MITPSGVTAAVYWNAIKAGNPQHIRITFLGQGIVLDDSDVDITNGATLTDIINGDTDLVFGKAVSKQLHVSIINSAKLSNLQWTGEFTLEMGVEINGTTEWVQVGIFSGEKPNNVTSVQIISFTAYDRMMLFDQLADKFAASITYPVTLATIYNNLCAYVGIQKFSGDELPNIMNRTFSTAPAEITGYTCRDILSWIAEACGCYATIDETGKVRMVWFSDNTAHAITGDEEFSVESVDVNDGMTWDEADQLTWDQIDQMTWNDVCGYKETYMIDRILVKQLDNDLDINYPENITDGNTYMIVDNPFLSVGSASDVTNYIVPLYNRMVTFGGYLPVELSCVGDWCVEAGDMVTIDVGTFTVAVPIFSKTMHWNGSAVDSYETTGQKTRNVYTTDANKQKVLNSKEIRLLVDGKYYEVQNGIIIDENGVDISGSKRVAIKSGGVFEVDSDNFEIDSEDKYMRSGNWKFNDDGVILLDGGGNPEFIVTEHSKGLPLITKPGFYFRKQGGDPIYVYDLVLSSATKDDLGNTFRGLLAMSTSYDGGSVNNSATLKILLYLYSSITVQRKTIEIAGGAGVSITKIRTLELKPDSDTNIIHPSSPSLVNPMMISTSSSDDIGYNAGVTYPDNVDVVFDNEIVDGVLYTRIHGKPKASPATGYMPLKIIADEFQGAVTNKTTTETDFNNITDSGTYWVHTGSMSNKPSNVEWGFVLLEVNKAADDLVYQKIWTRDRIHTRAKIQSNTFSAWKSVAFS